MALSILREHSKSRLIKILLLAVALSFIIGFGAMGYVSRSMRNKGSDMRDPNLWVARVAGYEIKLSQFQEIQQRLLRYYRESKYQQYGDMADLLIATQHNLVDEALNMLINQYAFDIVAANLGLVVTDGELIEYIKALPYFQVDGRFDYEKYKRQLGRNGEKEFEEQERGNLLKQKLSNMILTSAKVSDEEVTEAYLRQGEKINLQFIRLPLTLLPEDQNPTEAQLQEYFNANKARFAEPETREVAAVVFPAADYFGELEVAEDAIAEYYKKNYEGNQEMADRPAELHVRHILVKVEEGADETAKKAAQEKAEGLLKQLNSGTDFAELAKQNSDCPSASQGGDLGWYAVGGDWDLQFETAAQALEAGQRSGVVESQFGYHIIEMIERKPGGIPTLENAREEIVVLLKKDEGLKKARNAALQFKGNLTGDKTLAAFAAEQGKTVVASTPFKKNGIVTFPQETIADFKQAQEMAAKAYAMVQNDIGEPLEAGDKAYLYQLTKINSAKEGSLEDPVSRQKVIDFANKDLRRNALIEKGKALIAELEGGKSLTDAATTYGVEVKETGLFGRPDEAQQQNQFGLGNPVPELGIVPGLSEAAFTLTRQTPVLKTPYWSDDELAICVLKEKQEPDASQITAEERKQLHDQLKNSKAFLTLQAWHEQARQQLKIEYNEPIIEKLREAQEQQMNNVRESRNRPGKLKSK